ncbi:interleukin-2 receptor subunit beta isoform X2 [Genypterus blacodes]|uniref:interleukin-2 receptor subunit beta isoform X2 n=1 Tax=Genypterus blacodes TaxID=154954 RepID=UPI003F777EA9
MVMAMETLWSLVPVVLLSLHPAHTHTHRGLQGLSCLNDFVNNISCTWSGSPVGPGVDCWIVGEKKTWIYSGRDLVRYVLPMIRSCKLKQRRDSPPGCSFVFENREFSAPEVMPSIHMECNGTLVGNLTNYIPYNHIRMHPPSVTNVSTNANETRILWTPGSPVSRFFPSYEFKIEIKQKHQQWREATTLFTVEQVVRIPSWRVRGHQQVRVRVKPPENLYPNNPWSSWSPTTSWVGAMDSQGRSKVPSVHRLLLGGLSLLVLFTVVLVVLLRTCRSRGLLKGNPVPDPSKYFHTLHSVHGGNLKKWLNPQAACESFFAPQPSECISPVKVCHHWEDTLPSSSSLSTSALLHSRPCCPSAGSGTSGVVCHSSSSSSSFFSNMGYFVSSYSSSPPPPRVWNVDYFTYQDEFKVPHEGLHLSLCPAFAPSTTYECLEMEPQSPDSGFGIEKDDEEAKEDEEHEDAEGEVVSSDGLLLILPLHLPSRMGPPSSASSSPPLPSPPPPSLTQVRLGNPDPDEPVAAPSSSYAAWPVGATMSRSSSMPVEPSKTGYLTLKELQTTFSNKSI